MIGYVLKMFPRFSETFILSEILELERRGRHVHVISLRKPDDGKFHEEVARVRAEVHYLPEHVRCAPGRFVRDHFRMAWRFPAAYVKALWLCVRFLPGSLAGFLRAPLVAEKARATGCTRLHAHFATLPAVTAMFASVLSGIPFTFTAHAKDIFLDGRSKRMLRALLKRARRVVTVSDFNLRYLAAVAGSDLSREHIVRVYNGVDLDSFRPGAAHTAGNVPLVLAVGRLVEKKGFGDLINACALLRDRGVPFRCAIVGKGPFEADLARRIARSGLSNQVVLTGALPRGEVARRLSGAAVLAVPCVVGGDGNRDGLPTVILEAMAAGVPVVATRVTGIPEAVEDGVTGRVTEPGDLKGFASALALLLQDVDRRARMGQAGREKAAQSFDLQRNVALLDEILRQDTPPASEWTDGIRRGAVP